MNVRARIRAFISETFFVDTFAEGESFLTSGIIDSTGMMELVLFLEHEFSIQVLDGELIPENLDSLERASAFVARKQRALGAA